MSLLESSGLGGFFCIYDHIMYILLLVYHKQYITVVPCKQFSRYFVQGWSFEPLRL